MRRQKEPMNNDGMKLVNFDEYCESCKYCDEPETSDICNECLTNPVNQYSHKPIKYEEKK